MRSHDSNPFLVAAGGTAPKRRLAHATTREALPAPASPAAAEWSAFPALAGGTGLRIVLLAPLPKERKPANGQRACNALNRRTALFCSYISVRRQDSNTRCRSRS